MWKCHNVPQQIATMVNEEMIYLWQRSLLLEKNQQIQPLLLICHHLLTGLGHYLACSSRLWIGLRSLNAVHPIVQHEVSIYNPQVSVCLQCFKFRWMRLYPVSASNRGVSDALYQDGISIFYWIACEHLHKMQEINSTIIRIQLQ